MSDQETSQPVDHDDHRSPAENDALKGAEIKSGTGDPELAYPEQKGEVLDAAGNPTHSVGNAEDPTGRHDDPTVEGG
jgi:hypothetical protein